MAKRMSLEIADSGDRTAKPVDPYSSISATRRAWRPPSNSDSMNVRTISSAVGAVEPAAGERHDVRVVVGARELRLLGVVGVDGAHARHLVGDDRHADAGAADEHAALGVALGDEPRRGARVARVVGGRVGLGTDVDDVVAGALQPGLDVLLELEPCMV